jgi:hypothetical protein
MVGYKTVRASQTPDYEDNVKDIEGYAIMFREIIGDDMIAAVNTDEYLQEKTRREKVEELNKHVRAYNSRYEDEDMKQPSVAQIARMLQEVPSYQPGPGTGHNHLAAYQQQLTDIFRRTWKEEWVINPHEKFAEAAAREAVEFFWLTFKKNEQLEAQQR